MCFVRGLKFSSSLFLDINKGLLMEGITTEQDALYFKKRYKYFYVVCEGLWLACLRFSDASILTGWRLHMIILIGELF